MASLVPFRKTNRRCPVSEVNSKTGDGWKLALMVLLTILLFGNLSCQRHIKASLAEITARGVFHKVNSGENLWSICQRYRADIEEVSRLNQIQEPTTIKPGLVIFIPNVTRNSKANKPKPPKKRYQRPRKVRWKNSPPNYTGRKLSWPVRGIITSRYGVRRGRRHDGIDIACPEGTPIKAVANGEVTYSSNGFRGYGNIIIIQHSKTISTIYAHNQVNRVNKGELVKRGEIIGRVGKTGRVRGKGAHLHFEVRARGKAQNPLRYLK